MLKQSILLIAFVFTGRPLDSVIEASRWEEQRQGKEHTIPHNPRCESPDVDLHSCFTKTTMASKCSIVLLSPMRWVCALVIWQGFDALYPSGDVGKPLRKRQEA
jgi:hypothetical protein